MLIGLLRHGEARGGVRFRGQTDDPLTAHGHTQMQAALAAEPRWDRVISSPLRRCAEFARAFAARESLPFALDARLREIHFGAWEGRSAAELEAEQPDALAAFWRDPENHLPPGAESFADFRSRVLAVWDEVAADRAYQRVLLVAHGGVIRGVLGQLLGCSIDQLPAYQIRHGGLYRFEVDPDGVARPCFELAAD